MQALLSLPLSGYNVTFKPHYTQRAEEAYNRALTEGMVFKEGENGLQTEGIRPDALDRAAKAALAVLIEGVELQGKETTYTEDWLLDLPRTDYLLLTQRLAALQGKDTSAKEEGKKNPGSRDHSARTGARARAA